MSVLPSKQTVRLWCTSIQYQNSACWATIKPIDFLTKTSEELPLWIHTYANSFICYSCTLSKGKVWCREIQKLLLSYYIKVNSPFKSEHRKIQFSNWLKLFLFRNSLGILTSLLVYPSAMWNSIKITNSYLSWNFGPVWEHWKQFMLNPLMKKSIFFFVI